MSKRSRRRSLKSDTQADVPVASEQLKTFAFCYGVDPSPLRRRCVFSNLHEGQPPNT
jgi:hypothetical protein